MERRDFMGMMISVALIPQDPLNENDRSVVEKINKLSVEYIKLQSHANQVLKSVLTKPRYLRQVYHRMGELHTQMGVLFEELAER